MKMRIKLELIVGETTVLTKVIPLEELEFDNFKLRKPLSAELRKKMDELPEDETLR